MVSPSRLVIFGMAAFVSARDCTSGLFYCGRGLLHTGNYYEQMATALEAKSQPVDQDHLHDSVFHCLGGGEVKYQFFCGTNACIAGGPGNGDYCE